MSDTNSCRFLGGGSDNQEFTVSGASNVVQVATLGTQGRVTHYDQYRRNGVDEFLFEKTVQRVGRW